MINLLGLLHQTLLVNDSELRVMVLDTLYVLMTRSIVPVQDTELISMRREAFLEESIQGYGQVLDQVFSNMITTSNGVLDIDRDTYGVGKKFVMVFSSCNEADISTFVRWHPPSCFRYIATQSQPYLHFYTYSSNSVVHLHCGSASNR